MGKQEKQFLLDSKENCCIYLCKIISSSILCMDALKKYNRETEKYIAQFRGSATVPCEIYSDLQNKTHTPLSYLVNLLGDHQKISISYCKYRSQIKKRISKGLNDIPLLDISQECENILSEFNHARNWINHVPESLLISEQDLIKQGKLYFPMDPVIITYYESVTFEYFEDLYLSNLAFYNNAQKILQCAKKEYSLLMGKTILYPRAHSKDPIGMNKSNASMLSANIQGLKGFKLDP